MMKELAWNFHQQPSEVAYSMVEHQHQHMWIGDSGVSCHFTNDDTGFIKWRSINDVIGVGNNDVSIATKVGTIRLEVIQRNGQRSIITLNNCKYIPELRNNALCLIQSILRHWAL
jgi:hypothetical protein